MAVMKKRAPRRRLAKRAPRRNRRSGEVAEKASLTEVQSLPLVVANQNYSAYNISLATGTRAQDVAKGYQFYRIKRVQYIIKPLMDTFVQSTGPTTATVPYLYYMIDRVKQFVNGFTVNQLKAMGAKAHRLDEKTLTFSYTPSVLTQTYDNTAGANLDVQYKMSPWLPTKDATAIGVWNPNTTDHLGIVWRVDQTLGTAIGYVVERRIQFEFKKPAVPTTAGSELEVPIDSEDIIAPAPVAVQ